MAERKLTQTKIEEQADSKSSILVVPVVTVVDLKTGESESVWVWELED